MNNFELEERYDDDDVVCPYCDWRREANPCDGDASEDPSEHECEECGKTFILYASISITYHTKAKEANCEC